MIALTLVVLSACAPQEPASADADTMELTRTTSRALRWLARQQLRDGSFDSPLDHGPPRVALTSLACWALLESGPIPDERITADAVQYLLDHRQSDGGIYEPNVGPPHLTTLVASQALRSYLARPDIEAEHGPVLRQTLNAAEAFLQGGKALESSDAHPTRSQLGSIEENAESESVRIAARFLGQAHSKEADAQPRPRFTYDNWLRQLGTTLEPTDPFVSEVVRALKEDFRLNRPLMSGFQYEGQRPQSGQYYRYLAIARALDADLTEIIVDHEGVEHAWRRELQALLIHQQSPNGSWTNQDQRWHEGHPILTTSYALLALSACR